MKTLEYENLLPGLGNIKVIFGLKKYNPYYSIEIAKNKTKIEYFGEQAVVLGNEIFNNNNYKPKIITIDKLKEYANESTGGDWAIKTRKQENKLSRYLILWYLVRFGKKTLSLSAKIIGDYDHATAIHGIKSIEKSDKYKSAYEKESLNKFKQLLTLEK
jgi:hypothetical protein